MPLDAGKLRHKISIQVNNEVQQSDGSMISNWVNVYAAKWASIEPLSGREFLASSTQVLQATARIVVRYNQYLITNMRINKMRILHGARVYNIEAVLEDPDSGVEYLTFICSTGVLEATQSHG